jgi:hypothetical protein
MNMTDDDGEQCSYPRIETNFSSIEELTLNQEQGLLKLVKRLTSNFKLPSFLESDLEESIPKIREGLDYYLNLEWQSAPELYFDPPKKNPLICVSHPVKLSNGEVRDITFKSRFQSSNNEYRSLIKNLNESNSVRAKHWMHTDKPPLGCVLAVHGWMLGEEKISALTLVPGFFYRMGLDVLVVELPFHGSRSFNNFSIRNMFPSVDPVITNEGFAQAIFEFREIATWIKHELECPIIGLGLSLGAQAISLWSSLDELQATICVAPLVSIPKFIWKQVSGTPLEKSLFKAGLNYEYLESGFAVTSPISYNLRTQKKNVFIVAGKNDLIVPSSQAVELWKHWNRPKIHWIEDGHIEQLITPGTGKKVHNFLNKLGLASKVLEPAQKLTLDSRQIK